MNTAKSIEERILEKREILNKIVEDNPFNNHKPTQDALDISRELDELVIQHYEKNKLQK